ncbi:AsmA family protein [Nitrosococcus wardiae]|uniref:AsmA family protein n=1 Tax=Nitrosococcus wardiae TaxID=1814290 RepID=A0A4P7BZQ9_9GAMM|nr:AsmA family protein [Nitrosococcus wardiae]QBQ54022.1 AsmA family protein [Nitrosococcus wardiae]
MLKKVLIILASIPAILLLVIIIAVLVIDEDTVKGWTSSYIEQQYGRDLKVAGDLELDLLSLQPSITVEGVKLENANWADRDWMADIGKVFVQFKLLPLILGNIKILDAEITDGQIFLVEQQAKANWDVFLEKEREPGYFSVEQLENFKLNNVIVNYQDRVEDETHQLLAESIHLQEFFSPQRQGSFHGQLDSMPVSFQIEQKLVEAENVDRLLTLTGRIGTAEIYFTGDISDNFNWVKGRIRVKGPGESLTRIINLAGLNIKTLHSYDGFATVDANIERTTIDLTNINLKYGQSQMTGMIKANLNGDRTHIRGDLVFPVLVSADLKPYIKAKEKEVEKEKLFDDDPIGSLIPGGLELYLHTKIEKFIGGDWARTIQGGEGHLAIKGERLALYPVRVRMLGGDLAIEGLIDQSDKLTEANLKIKVDDFELNKISGALANLDNDNELNVDEVIGGNFDMVASLHFSGNSPQGMASSLTGDLNAVMEDGYMGSLLVEALQLDVTEAFASWLADNPKTEINCMVALFNINSGRMTTQAVVINTDDSNIIGSGVVNLDNESVDYTLVARAKDFSITGAPINMEIEGDLINPKLDIGGDEDSLLEVAADAVITPIVEGFKEIFGENDGSEKLTRCARFRDEIARIQRQAE